MASLGPGGSLDTEPLIRSIKDGGHLNKTLVAICVAEGMNKTGVKSELQNRIIESMSFPLVASRRSLAIAFPSTTIFSRV
jgi:hypothetical protein